MENSSHTVFEILHRLRHSSPDSEDIITTVPTLLIFLGKDENMEVLPEIISFLLGQATHSLPLSDAKTTILEPSLPLIKNYLLKILTINLEVAESVTSPDDILIPDLSKNLEVSVQVLTYVNNLLEYLITFDKLSLSEIGSAPKNIAEIIFDVFSHCQRSQIDYKEAFMAVRSELTCLFQKCHNIQVNLFTILNQKLVFHCSFEDEILILIEVLDILSLTAEIVAHLDTLSIVTHWKGYAQLTHTYSTHLCSRLDVAQPIKYIAGNINEQLSKLSTSINTEKKVVMRSLKITSLQLKVLIKLSEQYKGYLGECHSEIFSCLVSLCAYSSQYLTLEGVPADIATQVTTHLTAGAAPLLSHLILDPAFVEVYFQSSDDLKSLPQDAQYGFSQLTNLIIKKLINQSLEDKDILNIWLQSTLPLVETVFNILHSCPRLFFTHVENVYQFLLVHTAAFVVATCSSDMFHTLERILMREMLQPLFWPALFSSDMLCLIARFGSSELCLKLTKLLHDMLLSWPIWDVHRPEWVYVSWTLSRLMLFLSLDDTKTCLDSFPDLSVIATDINRLLCTSSSDDQVMLYKSMIKRLSLVGDNFQVIPDSKTTVSEHVYQLWQCVAAAKVAEPMECTHWLLGLQSVLVKATAGLIESFTNVQVGNILDVLTNAKSSTTSIFHFAACEILRSLATKTLSSDTAQLEVFQKISTLFVQLMQDKNIVAKQFALETFSYFAYVTKYEQIVTSTVANNAQLQAEITEYLKGVSTVDSNTPFKVVIEYLHNEFVHKCRTKDNFSNIGNNLALNPFKKLKTSSHEEPNCDILSRIETNVEMLEQQSCVASLNKSEFSRILNIVERLEFVLKSNPVKD